MREYYCIFDGYNLTAYVHSQSGFLVLECPKCKRRPLEISPWHLSQRPAEERRALGARFASVLEAQQEHLPLDARWIMVPVLDALRGDDEADAAAGDADADDEEAEEAAAMAANQPPLAHHPALPRPQWNNQSFGPGALNRPTAPKSLQQTIDDAIDKAFKDGLIPRV